MNREDLPVGLEVVTYTAYMGRVQRGWVTKVARKYVTISSQENWEPGMGREYDMATQRLRGDDGVGGWSVFRTLEQQALKDREVKARDGLKALGISASYGGPTSKGVLSLEEMEAIVELIRRMRGA